MTMQLAMTAAGLAAIADAANTGTNAVRFTRLAIGAGTGSGDQSARAALIDQKMIVAVTGRASGDTRIAIRADYSPTESFSVTEAGLFARVGTGAEFLAAYWVAASAGDALASAAAGTALIIAGVIAIESSSAAITVTPAVNIAIGVPDNVVLKTDHATVDKRGIVELATAAEAQAGTDNQRAVTPAGLEARIDDIPDSAAPPDASTTRRGLVELATNAEAQAGTDNQRAVTPAGLASRSATTVRRGVVELATTAEAKTGTDSARAVTPAGLKAAIDALIGGAPSTRNTLKKIADAILSATTGRRGIVELATNAEVLAGTDSERAVTPASLANFFGAGSSREFTTAGAHNYSWEWAATKCLAIIDGAGGGGGAGNGGGGGGGGAGDRRIFVITGLSRNQVLAITVGSGGNGGAGLGGNGGAGGGGAGNGGGGDGGGDSRVAFNSNAYVSGGGSGGGGGAPSSRPSSVTGSGGPASSNGLSAYGQPQPRSATLIKPGSGGGGTGGWAGQSLARHGTDGRTTDAGTGGVGGQSDSAANGGNGAAASGGGGGGGNGNRSGGNGGHGRVILYPIY